MIINRPLNVQSIGFEPRRVYSSSSRPSLTWWRYWVFYPRNQSKDSLEPGDSVKLISPSRQCTNSGLKSSTRHHPNISSGPWTNWTTKSSSSERNDRQRNCRFYRQANRSILKFRRTHAQFQWKWSVSSRRKIAITARGIFLNRWIQYEKRETSKQVSNIQNLKNEDILINSMASVRK